MNENVDRMLPNMTGSALRKILFLEIYFLLRVGKSPAYFTLTDFLDRYSLELLYIGVLFVLLSDWILIPAFYLYWLFAGSLAWCLKKLLGKIQIGNTYVFKELYEGDRKNRTGLELTLKYARANNDDALLKRVTDYDASYRLKVAAEKIAASNFILALSIVLISSFGPPNFLMMVTSFADPFTHGWAYAICVGLLIIQGFIGRAINFDLFLKSISLPQNFFLDPHEREKVAAWPEDKAGFIARFEHEFVKRLTK